MAAFLKLRSFLDTASFLDWCFDTNRVMHDFDEIYALLWCLKVLGKILYLFFRLFLRIKLISSHLLDNT